MHYRTLPVHLHATHVNALAVANAQVMLNEDCSTARSSSRCLDEARIVDLTEGLNCRSRSWLRYSEVDGISLMEYKAMRHEQGRYSFRPMMCVTSHDNIGQGVFARRATMFRRNGQFQTKTGRSQTVLGVCRVSPFGGFAETAAVEMQASARVIASQRPEVCEMFRDLHPSLLLTRG